MRQLGQRNHRATTTFIVLIFISASIVTTWAKQTQTVSAETKTYDSAYDYCREVRVGCDNFDNRESLGDDFWDKFHCLYPSDPSGTAPGGTTRYWNKNKQGQDRCQQGGQEEYLPLDDNNRTSCRNIFYNFIDTATINVNGFWTDNDEWLGPAQPDVYYMGVNKKCGNLSKDTDDRKICDGVQERFYRCKEKYIDKRVIEKDEEITIPPENVISSLTLSNFEEMSLYAKYIRTVLSSCRKSGQTYCQDNLLKMEATRSRIATLIQLTIYGSLGYSKNLTDSETIRISDMPGIKIGGSTDYSQPICTTFSQVSQIGIVFVDPPKADYQLVEKLCEPIGTAQTGADNLINSCKSSQSDGCRACDETISNIGGVGGGLLSDYKTQPMFLQTMYWNAMDNVKLGGEKIGWVTITSDERATMLDTLSKPDNSSNRLCELPQSDKIPANSPDFVCEVEGGLGWAVCGTTKLLLDGFDNFYKMLSSMLGIRTSSFQTDTTTSQASDTAAFKMWQIVSTIANIVAVMGFLIITISQVSGFGISNYGIKKMLPKLIVAIIIMNLSFFLVRVLVEASNIAGQGAYGIMLSIADLSAADKMSTGSMTATFWGPGHLGNAAINVITLAIMALLWLIATIVQVLVLAGRDAIIIIATVAAPLMVILHILPNTKKLTSFWKQAIGFALILYPMMAFIFGIARVGFLLSESTGGGFLNAIMARTILVLPLLSSPYLLFKIGKGVPLVSTQLNKLGKWATAWASGRPPDPKQGSHRYYAKQRRGAAIDQANRGDYSGWRLGQWIKSEAIKRSGYATGRIGAQQTLQSRNAQNTAREQNANELSLEDANLILKHYGGDPKTRPKLKSGSGAIAAMQLRGVSASEMILAASLAKTKYSQQLGTKFDEQSFTKAQNLAKRNGASQAALESTFRQTEAVYKGSNNYSATGGLKGIKSHAMSKPNSKGEVWGNYDESEWVDPNSDLSAARYKAVVSDMKHQVLEQPVDADGNKITLDINNMSDFGVKALVEEYDSDIEFESAIREQSGSFSSKTYGTIDKNLGGGLSYDFTSTHITQDLKDEVNQLPATERPANAVRNEFVGIFKSAGIVDPDKYYDSLSNDKLKAIVNNKPILTSDQRASIKGRSLKGV